jgi:aspartate racemase
MLRFGLVGGLGPESTIDYYRRIIELWQKRHPDSLPELTIDSLDVNHGIDLVRHDRAGLISYLHNSVNRLAQAGCQAAAMAANTPHIVFAELAAVSPIPLLSIVETCADQANRLGLQRVGLLGTGFTMEAPFYPQVFARRGVDVRVPDASARAWLHERYLGELLVGRFTAEARHGVRRMIDDLLATDRIDAIVLAGTELPLLLDGEAVPDLPVLDTTEIHVRAIVELIDS